VSNPARDGAAVAATQRRSQTSRGAKGSGSSYGRRSGYGAAMRVKARRQHCSASCLMMIAPAAVMPAESGSAQITRPDRASGGEPLAP
jgi:hypothetical protein